jgi:hypothetical protein
MKLKGCSWKRSWLILRYYSDICLEGLKWLSLYILAHIREVEWIGRNTGERAAEIKERL